jgi:hypothetical protein
MGTLNTYGCTLHGTDKSAPLSPTPPISGGGVFESPNPPPQPPRYTTAVHKTCNVLSDRIITNGHNKGQLQESVLKYAGH